MLSSLDDTALRTAIDLRDAYEATLRLWRDLDAVDGRMVWKTVKGRDYLYPRDEAFRRMLPEPLQSYASQLDAWLAAQVD